MIFKCQNCGGNILYNPEKNAMVCPHCDGIDTEDKLLNSGDIKICANCGAPIEEVLKDHVSALKCPNCGTYEIIEPRIEGEFKPDLVIPFKVSKDKAVAAMKKEFEKRVFTPLSFLSHATVTAMEGMYVPMFLYDYDAEGDYEGECTKVRSWSDAKYNYRETSYYRVERRIKAKYDNVPVDASIGMDDGYMDLMEPYNYVALEEFDPKYMSGFFGEKYNESEEVFAPRAVEKVADSMCGIVRDTIIGYDHVPGQASVSATKQKTKFALFPVWQYVFRHNGEDYKIYVNGQTGKVVGKTPVDLKLVIAYSFTVFGLLSIVGELVRLALSVI